MKAESQIHLNNHAPPERPAGIMGRQLEPGDKLEMDDVYDSTNGKWERCPCPGLVLQEGVATVWVRPS